MKNYRTITLIGALVATGAITLYYYFLEMMGILVIPLPDMLDYTFNVTIGAGWLLDFVVGLFFAYLYLLLFMQPLLKLKSNFLRGVSYGVIVFIISEVAIGLLDIAMNIDSDYRTGTMLMLLIGDVIYGIVLTLFIVPDRKSRKVIP